HVEAFGGRQKERRSGRACEAKGNVFETAEEKQLILYDRQTNVAAQAVLIVSRVVFEPEIVPDGLTGVQVAVLEVIVERAVDRIRSAGHGRVELPARRMSEPRGALVLHKHKILARQVRHVNDFVVLNPVLIVDTVEMVKIKRRTYAGYGWSRGFSDPT